MSYTYNVGDLVDAPGAAGMRPALIRKFVSHDSVVVDYIAKAFGSREVKTWNLKPNTDFDWCVGIVLDPLEVGDRVEGRFLHGEGGSKWFSGEIIKASAASYGIRFIDGDQESGVRRENIRTEKDQERSADFRRGLIFSRFKSKGLAQSVASYLAPASQAEAAKPKARRASAAESNAGKEAHKPQKPTATAKKDPKALAPHEQTYEQLRLSKNKTGYVVGEAVEAKHRTGGWHNATIVGIQQEEDACDIVYKLDWADGDETDRLKKVTSIRPRKTLTLEYYGSPSKRKAAFGAGDEFGVSKRKRLVANKMMLGNDNMRENRLAGNHGLPPQRVLPDIAVKKLSSGIHEGKAGAFAARKFGCGEVVACYAGKLALSSNVRRQAAAVLMQERVAKWPPDRNHPLIESVLATNYEWGPLKSRWLNSAIEQLYGDEDAEKLVIMPYPNYGNQTMAVNQCETAKQQNCIYIQANYKGFPYIFLVAFTEILRGEQLLAIMPKDNECFQNRKSCDFRIPGLVQMLTSASGVVPLTEPSVVWEQQLCPRQGQIYFLDDPNVERIRKQVEVEWMKEHEDVDAQIEICNRTPYHIDEIALREQIMKWLEPEVGKEKETAITTWNWQEGSVGVQRKEQKGMKAVSDPCLPKRPGSSYCLFHKEVYAKMASENPDKNMCQVSRLIAERWNKMPAEEKRLYEEQSEQDAKRYQLEKAAYDKENRLGGGLGGGGVRAFETEMVEQLIGVWGKDVEKWRPQKKTLKAIKAFALWHRWTEAGFCDKKLMHFIQRLQVKYATRAPEPSSSQATSPAASLAAESGESQHDADTPVLTLTGAAANGLSEQEIKTYDLYATRNNETLEDVSLATGIAVSELLMLNRKQYQGIHRKSRLRKGTTLRLNDDVTFAEHFEDKPVRSTLKEPSNWDTKVGLMKKFDNVSTEKTDDLQDVIMVEDSSVDEIDSPNAQQADTKSQRTCTGGTLDNWLVR